MYCLYEYHHELFIKIAFVIRIKALPLKSALNRLFFWKNVSKDIYSKRFNGSGTVFVKILKQFFC